MSAWFRYKYPHVTDGSLASSGVIKPTYDFWQFDQQIIDSMKKNPDCYDMVVKLHATIEDMIFNQDELAKDRVYNIFHAGPNYPRTDFMMSVNGIYGGAVQYGGRTAMCERLLVYKDADLDSQLTALYKENGYEFGQDFMSGIVDEKINFNNNMRQWTYQVCTQMGFLFTPAKNSTLTSAKLDMNYWLGYCQRAFPGANLQKSLLDGLNEYNMLFGATSMKGSNIFFTNGVEDGWQWAGMRQITEKNTSMGAHVVNCTDCAHCVDLYNVKDDDAQDLKDTRDKIRCYVKSWLSGNGFPTDICNEKSTREKLMAELKSFIE